MPSGPSANLAPIPSRTGSHRVLLFALAVFATVVASCVHVAGFEWAFLDDDINIVFNPNLQGWTPQSLAWAWTDLRYAGRYMPLGWMTYDGAFDLFGLNPHGYHLACVILASVDAVLLFSALRIWLRRTGSPAANSTPEIAAAFGALFWAWHPLRAETVAWNAALIYLASAAFAFIAANLMLLAATDHAHRPKTLHVTALTCYALSLLTYPIFLGLPLVLWLATRHKAANHTAPRRAATGWLAAWLILALIVGGANLAIANQLRGALSADPGWLQKFELVLRLNGQFLAHVLWPIQLSPYYGDATALLTRPRDWLALGGGAIAAICWARMERRKWLLLATWAIAAIALCLPFSIRYHPVMNPSDRYLMGTLAVLAAAVAWLAQRALSHPHRPRRIATLACLAAFSVVLLVSFEIALQTWQTPATVFARIRQVVARPDTELELSMVARTLWLNGYRKEAFAVIDNARSPDSQVTLRTLRLELLATEQKWQATPAYIGVRMPIAIRHCELGRSALERGNLPQARAHFREALRRWPEFPVASAGLRRTEMPPLPAGH
jgi:hypothetical protein